MSLFLRKIFLERKSYIIFCLFFLVYIFYGFLTSNAVVENDIFFGSDNLRVFNDLTEIDMIHGASSHPLFVILGQTFTLLINVFINNKNLAVEVLEALIGAYIVASIYNLFNYLKYEKTITTITTLIFGFSFAHIIFSTAPETFIFAGFWLVLYWTFLSYSYINCDSIDEKQLNFCLVVFGISSLAITITNYSIFIIALIFFEIYRNKKIKEAFLHFIKINIYIGFSFSVICVIQKLVWNKCGIAFKYIVNMVLFGNTGYDDFKDYTIGIEKTALWFKEIFMRSIISPQIEVHYGKHPVLAFGGYKVFGLIPITVFYLIFIFLIAYFIKNIKQIRFKKHDKFLYTSMLIALFIQIGLHYIMGYNEGFIYVEHFFYLIFILFAFLLNSVLSNKIKCIVIKILCGVLTFEILNNLYFAFQASRLLHESFNIYMPIAYSMVGSIITFIIVIIVMCLITFIEDKCKIVVLSIGADNFIKIFIRNIKALLLMGSIICLVIFVIYFDASVYKVWIDKIPMYVDKLVARLKKR